MATHRATPPAPTKAAVWAARWRSSAQVDERLGRKLGHQLGQHRVAEQVDERRHGADPRRGLLVVARPHEVRHEQAERRQQLGVPGGGLRVRHEELGDERGPLASATPAWPPAGWPSGWQAPRRPPRCAPCWGAPRARPGGGAPRPAPARPRTRRQPVPGGAGELHDPGQRLLQPGVGVDGLHATGQPCVCVCVPACEAVQCVGVGGSRCVAAAARPGSTAMPSGAGQPVPSRAPPARRPGAPRGSVASRQQVSPPPRTNPAKGGAILGGAATQRADM